MIQFSVTPIYRFFKHPACKIVSIHHKSGKIEYISFGSFNKYFLRSDTDESHFTHAVKKYLGPRWQRAFAWSGWAKKRLLIVNDYRVVAMLHEHEDIVDLSYTKPAMARFKILHYLNSTDEIDMQNYTWLENIKYPVNLFPRPQELTIDITSLNQYRVALALHLFPLYCIESEEEFYWLISSQETVRFKSIYVVRRWLHYIDRLRSDNFRVNSSYTDPNTWVNEIDNFISNSYSSPVF